MGLTTSGTYGPPLINSSASIALQSALENRLRAKTQMLGSTLYNLTWKPWITPLGVSRHRLRGSVRRTSATATIGWPTPKACDGRGSPYEKQEGDRRSELRITSHLTGWPTPNTPSGGRSVSIEKMDATGRTIDGKKHTASLEHAVKFSGWPTPMAGTPAQNGNNAAGNSDFTRAVTALTGWPTARVTDGEKNVRSAEGALSEMMRKGGPQDLAQATSLAGWSTPSARDHKDTAGMSLEGTNPDGSTRSRIDQLPRQVAAYAGWPTPTLGSPNSLRGSGQDPAKRKAGGHSINLQDAVTMAGPIRLTAHGEVLTGFSAQMQSGGQLNPTLPRWLMAYPAAWERSAPGWADWQMWQALTQQVLNGQRLIELGPSGATVTPSTPITQSNS